MQQDVVDMRERKCIFTIKYIMLKVKSIFKVKERFILIKNYIFIILFNILYGI